MFKDFFKRLLPTGRAHQIGPISEKLIEGNTDYMEVIDDETDSLLNGVLPDNNGFNSRWASRWESFLDLPAYTGEPIQTRRNRILSAIRPVNPNDSLITLQAMQNELDANGWAGILYVHENPNGLIPMDALLPLSPPNQLGSYQLGLTNQLLGSTAYVDYPYLFGLNQLGTFQLGNSQLGNYPHFNNVLANSLNRYEDMFVNLTPLRHQFYVGGQVFGSVATLPISDEVRLRKLLLRIKPASNVGFLLINYV